ncbi:diaminopropionate ammonia-lyase [Thalassovita taeanensis]|uniref:Diaminopropionate ammonia-lyase n=1 Tax=Thalassovita taeanensis TaxID=657014 RepID=A0A1H9J7W3_9RHOB|nr:diaminopropionate ammonia-lyase [Thalassovita taeanensis]SEQ82950.1 diaminopropionate ammonia-lyase [Thalassovita taeanensis]
MPYTIFDDARLTHFAAQPTPGDAATRVITPADFDRAMTEITCWEGYAPTPLVSLPQLADDLSLNEVLYKNESPRFGLGSFKALGGAYAALRVLQRQISAALGRDVTMEDIRTGALATEAAKITLVSATDGNHGRSLAWGCQRFGAPCRIYIHAEVSEARAEAMRALGAEVIRIAGDYDASVALARDEAAAHGWFVVSDTSWPGYTDPPRDVMAGYGVMTRECCDAMDRPPTHVFLQGGVGGLAASVAAGLVQYWGADAPSVVVVEPELAACLIESARQGRATTVQIESETIMAGLSCGEPSGMAWDILSELARDYLTIPDTLIGPTIRRLARPIGIDPAIEAGESGVAGLAGLIAAARQAPLRAALGLKPTSRVLLIGSEGVTDPDIFAALMRERADG